VGNAVEWVVRQKRGRINLGRGHGKESRWRWKGMGEEAFTTKACLLLFGKVRGWQSLKIW